MEASGLRGMKPDELDGKLNELVQTYFNLRFQHRTGQLENPKRIGQVRRDIARVKTIKKEQALQTR